MKNEPHSTNSSHWELIDQILDELLDSPSSERDNILTKHCGADTGLRQEVEKLLAATEKAADFMEVSPVESAARSLDLEGTASLTESESASTGC
jgi:hypothetical protein